MHAADNSRVSSRVGRGGAEDGEGVVAPYYLGDGVRERFNPQL